MLYLSDTLYRITKLREERDDWWNKYKAEYNDHTESVKERKLSDTKYEKIKAEWKQASS